MRTMLNTRFDAARDAERLLARAWQRGSDLPLPVDPVKIARRLGIDVVDARLDPDVSAAIVKERGQDPTILLNMIDSRNRQRFSCAHELGHFIRRSDDPDEYEYVDLRDVLSSKGSDPEEVYANEFAACLLMPEKEVSRLRRDGLEDYEMALLFDVSQEAMHYRLVNLRMACA